MLGSAVALAPAAIAAPVGAGFEINEADLRFILRQIRISEAHATTETTAATSVIGNGPNDVPNPLLPWGLRQVDGRNNNIANPEWGASDTAFPRIGPSRWDRFNADGVAVNYQPRPSNVTDTGPRTASNLIVDQSPNNPAAVAAAGPGAVADSTNTLYIPNVAPDAALSAPYNSMFTLFGQFFDHGLDLVAKTGAENVIVPLKADDPLFQPGSPLNFMVASRTVIDGANPAGRNSTTPYVDQNQTYTSHPSHQVFLREYVDSVPGGAITPVATGRLIDGANGNIGSWAEVKAQTAAMLGIELRDQDIHNVPLMLTDEYGRFLRGPARGLPQLVLSGGGVVEGNIANPVTTAGVVGTGHAFLDDIAHEAVPAADGSKPADGDATLGNPQPRNQQGQTTTYDNELLDSHFITGDGRGNENIGLTAIHTVFHAEHNRVVADVQAILAASTDAALVSGFQSNTGWGYGERLFQTARFVTEMEYQHLVFEEFARKVQPAVRVFAAYDPTLNADIKAEFAHAVYRFGHSMLNETVERVNADGTRNDIQLFDAFLNPAAFNDNGQNAIPMTAAQAAGSIARGMTYQIGNELDEFVTDALRNRLVGLPLDLATINMVRGRDTGMPTLNELRRFFFSGNDPVWSTGDPALKPYANWNEYGLALRNPESLVNYIAAYGTDASVINAGTTAGKRAAAQALVDGAVALDPGAVSFMTSPSTGIENVDLWVGGLGEKQTPFSGLLGPTFNHVFQTQLENLQEGDRFYYLARTAGMNLLTQLEGNSLSEIIMRNTDATNLPADVFSRPGFTFDMLRLGNFCNVIEDDPTTEYDESALLTKDANQTVRYSGVEHVAIGGTQFNDRIWADEGDDTLRGDDGNDWIEGGSGVDNIVGGAGDDILNDLGQDDTLKGGPGNDVLNSGPGIDLNQGGTGHDFVTGGTGGTETLAGGGNDRVFAGQNADIVLGDDGDDWIEGGLSGDGLTGDTGAPFGIDINAPGDDVLIGDSGDDDSTGEGGNDISVGGAGTDRFDGGFGYDWQTQRTGAGIADFDLSLPLVPANGEIGNALADRFQDVEALSGGPGNDLLGGDDVATLAADPLIPGSSQELVQDEAFLPGIGALVGGADVSLGNILIGGPGSDTITGKGGNDLIDGDAWLNVQLRVPDLANPGDTRLVNSLLDIRQDVLDGNINPADIHVVRTIQRAGLAAGTDVAVFAGPQADYLVSTTGNSVIVVDNNPAPLVPRVAEGTDTLRGVEILRFADGDVPTSGLLPALAVLPPIDAPSAAVPATDNGNPGNPRNCITGVPTAPRNVTATSGDQSAGVTWNVPLSDRGSAIQSYKVEWSLDGLTWPNGNTKSVTGLSTTVSGLANNDSVTFRVSAVNGAGAGPAGVSNIVVPAVVVPGGGSGGGGGGGGSAGGGGSTGGGGSSSSTPPASPAAPSTPTAPPAESGAVVPGTVVVSVAILGAPSGQLAKAPSAQAKAGQSVVLKLRKLPKKTSMTVRVKIDGAWVSLGRVKTSKRGTVTVPAFTVDKAGTYPVQLKTAKGAMYYVKVIVT